MICRKCGTNIGDDCNFCPNCGTKSQLSFDEIKANVERRVSSTYLEPYGLWEVTTFSDSLCSKEKVLGLYEGFIDDIAFALQNKSIYELKFKKLPNYTKIPESDKLAGVVEITLRGVETKDGIALSEEEEKALICLLMQNRLTSVFESDRNLKPLLVKTVYNY